MLEAGIRVQLFPQRQFLQDKMQRKREERKKLVMVNSRVAKKALEHRKNESRNGSSGQLTKYTAYSCTFCVFSCGDLKDLDLHVKILHKNQHFFSCSLCHYTSDKSHLLSLHMLLHSSDMKYSCVLCNLKFNHLYYVKRHVKNHLGEKPSLTVRKKITCPHCCKEFCRKVNYATHILKHSQDNIYKCFWCDFAINQVAVLDDHMYSHGTDTGLSCTECHSCFLSLLDHTLHMLINHEKVYLRKISTASTLPCTLCGEVFHKFNDLRFHIFEIHAKHCSLDLKDKTVKSSIDAILEKKYLCASCGNFLRTSGALKMHKCKSMHVKVLKCSSCPRTFRNKALLKSHEYLHTGLKPLTCPECPYRCRRKQYLKRHMLIHSGEKTHLCTVCGQTFLFHDTLKNHMHKHSSEEPTSCSVCSFTTSDPNELTRHMAKHISNFFSCESCSFTCMREVDLKKHQLTHVPEKAIPCSSCHLRFTSAKDLQSHMLTHVTVNNPINYTCKFCSYFCQVQKDYIRHMQTHSISKPFACEICDYSSNRRVNLKMHMKRQHKLVLASVVSFLCKLCNFACERDQDFIKHMRFSHSVDKPFDCPVCPFSTHRQSLLKVHMDTHKPHGFSCSLCPFKCKRRTLLNKHMASKHIDNAQNAPDRDSKLYRCKFCEFTSKHYASLRNHKPIHSGVRFPCDECNYVTYSKRNLESHKKSHIKLKPFKCPFCDYTSARKNNFKIHMVRHINEKLYYCDICDFKCKAENELVQHKFDLHTGEVDDSVTDTSKNVIISCSNNNEQPQEKFSYFSKSHSQNAYEQGTLFHATHTVQIAPSDVAESQNTGISQEGFATSTFKRMAYVDQSASGQLFESQKVIMNYQGDVEKSNFREATQNLDQSVYKEHVCERTHQSLSVVEHNPMPYEKSELQMLVYSDSNPPAERSADVKQPSSMNLKCFGKNKSLICQVRVPFCAKMGAHHSANPSFQSQALLQPTKSQKKYTDLTPYQSGAYMRNDDVNLKQDIPTTANFYITNFTTMYPQSNSQFQDHYHMFSQQSETEFMQKTGDNCHCHQPVSLVGTESIMERNNIHIVTEQQNTGNKMEANSEQELTVTFFPQLVANLSDENVFTCSFCSFSCVGDQEFKQHLTVHTIFSNQSELKFACYSCEISFTSSDALDGHNREYHHQPVVTEVSNEKNSPVRDVASLPVWINKKQEGKGSKENYICSLCSNKFDRSCDFKRHMLSTHGVVKAFSCKLCSYSTKREDDLKTHKITHDKGMKRSCSLCDYTCKRSPALRKHMQKHTDVRLFNCNLCDFWSNYEPDLRSHIIKAHENAKHFTCHICKYSCEFAISFKKHMALTHSIENAFVCPHCDYSTHLWNNFRAHRLKHTCSKKFTCKVCSFLCKTSFSLKNHMCTHFQNKSLKCSKCDYRCDVAERLKIHMSKHHNERQYVCKACYRSYTHSSSLYKHISVVHKKAKRHSCPKCSYVAPTPTLLRRHMLIHGVGMRFHCKLCKFDCNHFEVLRNHMLVHDLSITTTPTNCYNVQTSNDNKEKSNASDSARDSYRTKKKQFSCSHCNHSFTNSSNLYKHMIRHNKSRHVNQFLCSICEFSCLRPHELKIHTCFHTGEKLFQCDKCEFATNRPYNLKYHKEKEHRNHNTKSNCKESGLLQCPACKLTFSTHLYLKYHIQDKHQGSKCIPLDQPQAIQDAYITLNTTISKEKISTSATESVKKTKDCSSRQQPANIQRISSSKKTSSKQFLCTQCNYATTRKGNLTTHMQKHREKNFLCHLCDYICRRKRELNRHLLTHEEKKPLSCKLCSYTCIQSANLKIHMLKHKGEKPIQCQLCDFRCRQRSTLRDHMTTHSDERRFSCHKCDYKAKRAVCLKMHLLMHTSEKPVCCNLCDFTCKHTNALRSHMQSHVLIH